MGKLPQEAVGIADNRVNAGSLCVSEFKIVHRIVKFYLEFKDFRRQTFHCRETQARETEDYHQNGVFKSWSPLAKDVAAIQEASTGDNFCIHVNWKPLYQNTAPRPKKLPVNQGFQRPGANDPSAN